MSYLPLIDLKNVFWPVVHLLYGISEWNFTDMLNIKGYIFLVRTVTLTFPVHELSALDWSEKWFLTCSSFTIWSIWMKLHRYVDHQRLHIVTKDVISLSISVLLLFRHYISHKITFGAPSSGGVLRSACGAFIIMGNYFNELRWNIIKANDLLQYIHQFTIEIRFRKSLTQEKLKSKLEFRN